MGTTARSDAALASALRIALMRLVRRLRRERADASLSITKLAALGTLDRHGPLTPGELAAEERVRPPSMTRILASLESLDLVERAPHPSDGRQTLVSLTPGAHRLLTEDRRRRDEWLTRQLGALAPEERAVLQDAVGILERLGRV